MQLPRVENAWAARRLLKEWQRSFGENSHYDGNYGIHIKNGMVSFIEIISTMDYTADRFRRGSIHRLMTEEEFVDRVNWIAEQYFGGNLDEAIAHQIERANAGAVNEDF